MAVGPRCVLTFETPSTINFLIYDSGGVRNLAIIRRPLIPARRTGSMQPADEPGFEFSLRLHRPVPECALHNHKALLSRSHDREFQSKPAAEHGNVFRATVSRSNYPVCMTKRQLFHARETRPRLRHRGLIPPLRMSRSRLSTHSMFNQLTGSSVA